MKNNLKTNKYIESLIKLHSINNSILGKYFYESMIKQLIQWDELETIIDVK